jgi:ferredoxin
MRDLVERLKHDSCLPEIEGDDCVHSLMENASCTACVDVCPQGAWLLNDDSLGFDTEACDSCGLCVSSCPEGAIRLDGFSLVLRENKGRLFAFGACEYAQVPPDDGIIPCIHALTLQDILQLIRKGVRAFIIATGDCCQCHRGGKNDLLTRVEQLNDALHEISAEGISIKRFTTNEWYRLLDTEMDIPSGPSLDRRNFLRALVTAGAERKIDVPDLFDLGQSDSVPLGKLIPYTALSGKRPFVPVMDIHQCNGCDACVRLCPHEAIIFEKTDIQSSYHLEPSSCTGCFICVDVCESNAININSWQRVKVLDIPLAENRCSACGNAYHQPVDRKRADQDLCRICSKHNHYKNLHQILADS